MDILFVTVLIAALSSQQVPELKQEASILCGADHYCFNTSWSTPSVIDKHVNNAMVIGGHSGVGSLPRFPYGASPINLADSCNLDPLYNNVESANRNLWMLKCGYETSERVYGFFYYFDYRTFSLSIKPSVYYPVFTTADFKPYVLGRKSLDYRVESCNLPSGVYTYAFCEPESYPPIKEEVSSDCKAGQCTNALWATESVILGHVKRSLEMGRHDGTQILPKPNISSHNLGEIPSLCAQDKLFGNLEAANRALLALKCKHATDLDVVEMFMRFDFRTRKYNVLSNAKYPLYAQVDDDTGGLSVYPVGRRDADYRKVGCDFVPSDAFIYTWCPI